MTKEEITRAVKEMLDYLQFGGDIDQGIALYHQYGNSPALKRQLPRMPKTQLTQRRIDEAIRTSLRKKPYWREYIYWKSRTYRRVRDKEPEQNPEAEMPPVIVAANRTDAIDDITLRIRKLATKRAQLSNQLQETDRISDKKQQNTRISDNAAILEKMQPISAEIKRLEEQRAKLRSGDEVKEPEGLDRVVVSTRSTKYTLRQLQDMSLEDLMRLKKKTHDLRIKAERSMKDMKLKEKTRKRNAERFEQKKRELKIITRIESEKKYG